jgi:3-methyladenine DNA glycosylase AlkD
MSELSEQVTQILSNYIPAKPEVAADALRAAWLQFEPKSIAGIKAELREQQETVGVPVPVLKDIGAQLAKVARKRVADYTPLARCLWDAYGREGRVVAVYILGAMELSAPEAMIPLIIELCRTCITWEDADQLAMNALEPIVRQQPDRWLTAIEPWLADENKWVRRAVVTTIGRLTMKHGDYTARCVELAGRLINDADTDVKKAASFALRICARGDSAPVRDFLAAHVPPADPAATWVLCDAIRSMAKALLPEFTPLLARYEQWAADPTLSAKDRRSVLDFEQNRSVAP